MVEPITDRLAEHGRDVSESIAEIPSRDVHSERQRQARLLLPPDTEVEPPCGAPTRRR